MRKPRPYELVYVCSHPWVQGSSARVSMIGHCGKGRCKTCEYREPSPALAVDFLLATLGDVVAEIAKRNRQREKRTAALQGVAR